ncbi:MAG TPA: retropepsin-like aspartic protease [Chthonomonadaceae bacterium]|nr:retropepsin-like aspartic protease [Chthonomonadaceae bacterium]
MRFPFNPHRGPIVIQAELWGPGGNGVLQLAVDTGATSTIINTARLMQLGYDPALAPQRVQVTTVSGVVYVPRLALDKIAALGQERISFPVLCHTLPPSAAIDGLLGLDFFRGQTLTIDFRSGQITLA